MVEEGDSEVASSETTCLHPVGAIGIGVLGGFIALIALGVLPIGGRVRFGNSECAWLDPYRIPRPSEIGWTSYIIVSLLFCVCYGSGLGLLRWGVSRLLPWPLAKQTAAWLFFGFAVVGTFLSVPYFYRLPRMPWP
jgi:hypothetical protein